MTVDDNVSHHHVQKTYTEVSSQQSLCVTGYPREGCWYLRGGGVGDSHI